MALYRFHGLRTVQLSKSSFAEVTFFSYKLASNGRRSVSVSQTQKEKRKLSIRNKVRVHNPSSFIYHKQEKHCSTRRFICRRICRLSSFLSIKVRLYNFNLLTFGFSYAVLIAGEGSSREKDMLKSFGYTGSSLQTKVRC